MSFVGCLSFVVWRASFVFDVCRLLIGVPCVLFVACLLFVACCLLFGVRNVLVVICSLCVVGCNLCALLVVCWWLFVVC